MVATEIRPVDIERRGGRYLGGALLLLVAAGLGIVQPIMSMRIIDAVSAGGAVVGLVALLIGLFVAQAS
ncbi:hypothetical protein [Nocardia sp. CNY236]|uniref:hypothetical protein n=1 Tax=Nocardia sp. CNY236 TaxID=1169152 RepID=UPI0004080A4B|nr:hypothetical protein [Nocardia sp. CNY236]